jgi:hypothetical protein
VTLDEAWEANFTGTCAFYAANGRLPQRRDAGEAHALGVWVTNQHVARATMPAERREKLEACAWWSWSVPNDEAWNAKFTATAEFFSAHNRLPRISEGALGKWASHQRAARATMAPERRARLDAAAWWSWTVPR